MICMNRLLHWVKSYNMTYEITPQIGYGPIKFGMSPEEVEQHLGRPLETSARLSETETDEEEILYNSNQQVAWYGDEVSEKADLQVTYLNNSLIFITIFKKTKPLVYKGMNLHKFKSRQDNLEILARDEDVYYYDESGYFFPKSGLIVPIPKFAKRNFYIMLALTSYMIPRLEFEMYEPSTALD